ncbi:MAG: F0F1 ATP synthase subunit delta [Sulfurimonas sp. RIFCSPHIGHO2_12_FULL_36_9]|jgi:F-type H+-transporting ATPase subunit delta|uniref:F0F1 ATP synthase subunit delta n=1 Tax=Sulfurimonas sp. RIFCSPLOWO2_12_36_12 TaxID=1802253 RepID=UPI0008CE51DD|nr:F0F1 ATP synthase subunit delta [Sulfurimonas sp. RIFCSPLOWO2_12_36_12]OHD97670.1 MAG: F0F1 ATP synthase subunit delta [Sulfurimonas sp. RIFCSPHIGHO2_12_FULL_36_9]OHD98095.1 MAG: F0F1 ATP synthase subunit delta [Sulfurimonas sp. RIFCSPLOWO2_02_FULL_36_28]OHE01619.1 MAG: F0F1 ATP synthase subunit delta [Sulfurimonas sp. RIFCSPLOWO2_12_36_12]OHE03103.1 MAG: F0F1 ATP synthase subunit delta [Sulfurimonas sp. RIFCSPLOWO2_12_FULL_36_74]
MEELIAKRYLKAIKHSSNAESMKNIALIFSVLAEAFNNEKFNQIINNPDVSKNQKSEILLAAVKSTGYKNVENLIKLLAEHNRINIIPALAEVMRKDIAKTSKIYDGIVYSDSDIDSKVIEDLGNGLGSRFDSKISLKFVKDNFKGIKVDVEDLGVEISFSKSRINDQMIEHIIKAI